MKSRIVVWGLGQVYRKYVSVIKRLEDQGQLEVVGVTDQEKRDVEEDGYPYLEISEIMTKQFDYLVTAAEPNIRAKTRKSAVDMGIPESIILPIHILALPGIQLKKYADLYASGLSVIAINCWGGLILHRLGMKFNSPFVNLFVRSCDYIKLLQNFQYYMSCPFEFVRWNYDSNTKLQYPVMKIGDVEIHCNHDNKIEDAVEKWNRRKKRINYDNLFVMYYTSDPEAAAAFDDLKFKKKICFTSFESDLKSAFYLKICETLDTPFFNVVNGCASGRYEAYNPIDLLRGEMTNR